MNTKLKVYWRKVYYDMCIIVGLLLGLFVIPAFYAKPDVQQNTCQKSEHIV